MYQELFWAIKAKFQFQKEEVELKIKRPFRRGFAMNFRGFSGGNGLGTDQDALIPENMVEDEVVGVGFEQQMVEGRFQDLAEVLVESFLVLIDCMGFLQLLYLSSTESTNDEELKVCGIYQKISLHSFKKVSIFHCTYSDYAYLAYENHKPAHPLKMSHSSFQLTRGKFGCCLPNSIIFSFSLPCLYQQIACQSSFFHLNL